jgi:hypothetical protein
VVKVAERNRYENPQWPDLVSSKTLIYKCSCGCVFRQVASLPPKFDPQAGGPGAGTGSHLRANEADDNIRATQAWPIRPDPTPQAGSPDVRLAPESLGAGERLSSRDLGGGRPNEFWLALHELSQALAAEGKDDVERMANIARTFELMPEPVQREVLTYVVRTASFLQDLYPIALVKAQDGELPGVPGPHYGKKQA